MTDSLRWRILSLQGALIVVFAFLAGFAFWGANFTHSQVHDQLIAQKIAMPDKATLSPKEYSQADITALAPYSGSMLDNGNKAKAYADHYIQVHLNAMGMTYSQASAKYMALTIGQKLPATNPKVQALGNLRQALFMGTTLRGSLLQAYAWDTIGSYAFFAAIGLTFAALVVLIAFLFELVVVPRREGVVRHEQLVGRPISVAS